MKDETGDYVPSLLFQHIPVPEMWNVLKEVPKSHKPHAVGYRSHYGKYYWMDEKYLIPGNCDFLLETPATPEKNSGEFNAAAEKGDVLAMFSVMTIITALLPTIKMLFSVIHRVADLMFTVPI